MLPPPTHHFQDYRENWEISVDLTARPRVAKAKHKTLDLEYRREGETFDEAIENVKAEVDAFEQLKLGS